jgi:phage terminase large subunit
MVFQSQAVKRVQNLEFPVSPVFLANHQSFKLKTWDEHKQKEIPRYRFIINQGGSRSGKTYSILQIIILYILFNKGKVIDIVRKTHNELADSVVKDFDDIIEKLGLTGVIKKNKTRYTYTVNGNLVRFIGVDKAQKKRGSWRDILYINEANGISLEDYIQLTMRTNETVFIDFNPSEYFWVYDQILEKPNVGANRHKLIKSTYLDNYDFLDPDIIMRIESLMEVDEFYYQVYALGNLFAMKGKIYTRQELVEADTYDTIDYSELYYGLDFGYDHPTALIECKYANEKVYERERLYKSHMSEKDIVDWFIENDISMTAPIYADPANPSMIFALRNAGFNIIKAKKDVVDGIRFMQRLTPHICKTSENLIKERKAYKWRQRADNTVIVGEVVKINDDLCDAERYANYSHRKLLAA